MSLALDTNLLLYASDEESPLQPRAIEVLSEVASGTDLVYLFWPVISGYLRIATHSGIFRRPLESDEALANVADLLQRAHIRTPSEPPGFWAQLREAIEDGAARGNLVSDAHLVALMRNHGVRTILTRDRDFRRFDGIRVQDPFAST